MILDSLFVCDVEVMRLNNNNKKSAFISLPMDPQNITNIRDLEIQLKKKLKNYTVYRLIDPKLFPCKQVFL